jgi:hypothetical protein
MIFIKSVDFSTPPKDWGGVEKLALGKSCPGTFYHCGG